MAQLGLWALPPLGGRIHGDDSVCVARVLIDLGSACGRWGDAVRQKEYLENALRIRDREYGPPHPEVAPALTSVSSAGDLPGARMETGREKCKRRLGASRSACACCS